MGFLIPTLLRAALGSPPRLVCIPRIWRTGVNELRRRADGRRESGAFLLGRVRRQTRRIEQFLFYDAVDPNCFRNGIVMFDGRQFGKVWDVCRTEKLAVVADVHVHPCGYGQSSSDKCNPMIAEIGHVAIIIPNYVLGDTMPPGIGLYEYLGARKWKNCSKQGSRFFHIGWWPH
jgi:hypothetical protein